MIVNEDKFPLMWMKISDSVNDCVNERICRYFRFSPYISYIERNMYEINSDDTKWNYDYIKCLKMNEHEINDDWFWMQFVYASKIYKKDGMYSVRDVLFAAIKNKHLKNCTKQRFQSKNLFFIRRFKPLLLQTFRILCLICSTIEQ